MHRRLLYTYAGYAILMVCLFIVLLRTATATIGRDEHMYVSASLLAQDQRLYSEFSYFQMPYLPLLHGAVYQILNTQDHFVISRLINWATFCCSTIVLFAGALRVSKSVLFSMAISFVFLFNSLILAETVNITNSAPANLLLISAAFLFLWRMASYKEMNWWSYLIYFLTGAAIGLAIGLRLTYAIFVIPFFAGIVSDRNNKKSLLSGAMFIGGVAVALIPVVILFLSDPDAFVFNNIGYHLANEQWRLSDQEMLGSMSLPAKVWNSLSFLTDATMLLLLLVFSLSIIYLASRYHRPLRQSLVTPLTIFVVLLLSTSLFAAFYPSPPQPRYYTMFVVSIVISTVIIFTRLHIDDKRHIMTVLLVASLCISYHSLLRITRELLPSSVGTRSLVQVFSELQSSTIMSRLKLIKAEIRTLLSTDILVASITPIYALEAGYQIPAEFSTGVFGYRVGDFLSESLREKYVLTSFSDLHRFLDRQPPTAILTGSETSFFEGELIRYAINHGYQVHTLTDFGLTLYLPSKVDKSTQ